MSSLSGIVRLAIVVPTYKRPTHLANLVIGLLKSQAYVAQTEIDIVVLDDSEDATSTNSWMATLSAENLEGTLVQKIYAVVRSKNLGQGRNLLNGLLGLTCYDYVWVVADDDELIIEEAVAFLGEIVQRRPLIGVCDFRQGPHLEAGTNFSGDARNIVDPVTAAEIALRFGKGSNVVIRQPGQALIEHVADSFAGSFYEDKALLLLLIGGSLEPCLFLYPRTTVVCRQESLVLPYSMRVFANLRRVMYRASESPAVTERLVGKQTVIRNEWQWWWRGLVLHFAFWKPIRYAKGIAPTELTFPIRRLWKALVQEEVKWSMHPTGRLRAERHESGVGQRDQVSELLNGRWVLSTSVCGRAGPLSKATW